MPFEDIERQLDCAWYNAGLNLLGVTDVAYGNEGSILDERTFLRDQLEYVIRRATFLPHFSHLSLETRNEFIDAKILDEVRCWSKECQLTLKIGLESISEEVREGVLKKHMSLDDFERAIKDISSVGARLSSYVLYGADPRHTAQQAYDEARATCTYLMELTARHGVSLLIRINPMYGAEQSPWLRMAQEVGWTPPSIYDVAKLALEVLDAGSPVYIGLSEEGLAKESSTYQGTSEYQPAARILLEQFNDTQERSILNKVIELQA